MGNDRHAEILSSVDFRSGGNVVRQHFREDVIRGAAGPEEALRDGAPLSTEQQVRASAQLKY